MNREIIANGLDVGLAPDGSTPTSIVARDNVRLTVPNEGEEPARTITAQAMDATGDADKGLTNASFAGKVQFRERGADITRDAFSNTLDVTLAPGLSSIEDATFKSGVRFVEGALTATSAEAKYLLSKGALHLGSSEPKTQVPRISNDRIAVDAALIDVVLEGPQIKATGTAAAPVKSVLSTPQKPQKSAGKSDPKVPSMLKQDQPVNVSSRNLNYDGTASRATFEGDVVLFQSETTIKGATTLTIDDKTGDLTASGNLVTTNAVIVREGKDKKKTREKSSGSGKEFRYDETQRRARYIGGARLSGLGGELAADQIDLFLKISGDEVDRAEGRGKLVTFTEEKRNATGTYFQYFSGEDERYEVTGKPMIATDECGRKTNGVKLIYYRVTDRMAIDGGPFGTQSTQAKSSEPKCP